MDEEDGHEKAESGGTRRTGNAQNGKEMTDRRDSKSKITVRTKLWKRLSSSGALRTHLRDCELIWGMVKRTTQWAAGGRISRWDGTRRTPKPPDGGLGERSRLHERPSAHRRILHAGGDVPRIAGRRPACRRQTPCVSPTSDLERLRIAGGTAWFARDNLSFGVERRKPLNQSTRRCAAPPVRTASANRPNKIR